MLEIRKMSSRAQNKGAFSQTIYIKALKTIRSHIFYSFTFKKHNVLLFAKLYNVTVSFPTSKQCPDTFQIEQLALVAFSSYEKITNPLD